MSPLTAMCIIYLSLITAIYMTSSNAAIYNTNPVKPTAINETGEYYLVYNSSTYDFKNQSIVCAYDNATSSNITRNCYIICDKLEGCLNTNIECNNSSLCSIDCSASKSCTSAIITSSYTNTFSLTCNGNSSCSSLTTTYNNSNNANIICNQNDSCTNINIAGHNSFYSSLSCIGNNSCIAPTITTSNIINVSLLCNGPKYRYPWRYTACSNTSLTATNSSLVNVTSGYQMKYTDINVNKADYFLLQTLDQNAARGSIINVHETTKVFISCYYDSSCYGSTYNIYDNPNVTWYCGYTGSGDYNFDDSDQCSGSKLSAPNANALDIVFNALQYTNIVIIGPEYYVQNSSDSSSNESVIVPRSNVKCVFDGCWDLSFKSPNGIIDWNIYFNFDDPCDYIDTGICNSFTHSSNSDNSYYVCLWEWTFNCGIAPLYPRSGQYYPITSNSFSGSCGDQDTFNEIKSQFNSVYNTNDCYWDWAIPTEDVIIILVALGIVFGCGGLGCCYWCSFRRKRAKYPTLL